MHLLYYGSQQEKLLHTERALKLLEEQSTKMGLQYDDPKSVDHIIPFVRRLSIPFVRQGALLHHHVPHKAWPPTEASIPGPCDKDMLCLANLT